LCVALASPARCCTAWPYVSWAERAIVTPISPYAFAMRAALGAVPTDAVSVV